MQDCITFVPRPFLLLTTSGSCYTRDALHALKIKYYTKFYENLKLKKPRKCKHREPFLAVDFAFLSSANGARRLVHIYMTLCMCDISCTLCVDLQVRTLTGSLANLQVVIATYFLVFMCFAAPHEEWDPCWESVASTTSIVSYFIIRILANSVPVG